MDEIVWRDRLVLVTGASGFVGGWLVKKLQALGADVVCLVRDWIPQSQLIHDLIGTAKMVNGDICDQPMLERVLGEYEVSAVFHLAAQTIVGVAKCNPVSTFESDIRGTWCLLEACRRSPLVQAVVIASSDKCYGEQPQLPYTEEMPLRALYPYDVSKSCVDLLSQSYIATYGMPVAIARCGNIYGGGDINWSRIIPGTVRSVLRCEPPIIRSDGKFIRDYLYVEDVVDAYKLLAERLLAGNEDSQRPFNFSCEQPIAVLDLVSLILSKMNSKLQPVVLNKAVAEIRRQYLSAALAREVIGWHPRYTLEEGLPRTIGWYLENIEW